MTTKRQALSGVAVLALVATLVLGSPAASAATISVPTGPLVSIETTPDLNCAVSYLGDAFPSFYDNTACGTFVAAGGVLYGPENVPAGGGAAPRTAFTPISQSPVTGSGTAADPYRIVTEVGLGDSGLRISQTDTYIAGQEAYVTTVNLTNTSGGAVDAIIYRAGDCFLADDDDGFGSIDGAAVSCVAEDGRIIQWFPLTSGSSLYEAGYSQVWSVIGSQQPFDNTCRCDELIDNGAGLSWVRSVPAGGTVSVSHITTFSPLGFTPLQVAKTTSTPTVEAGGQASYTISIPNPNQAEVVIEEVIDLLPEGFAYVPGSTTGATTADPALDEGGNLVWVLDAVVPAGGTFELSFSATVSGTPGTYFNSATAFAGPVFVIETGETAPVEVVAPPPPGPAPVVTPTTTPAPAPAAVAAAPRFTG